MKSRRRSNKPEGPLDGKKILLVVSGGISAYKAAVLVRALKRAGSDVRVILTEAASKFVTPLTFEVLSENPVPMDMFAPRETPSVEHVELARWADRIVIAPATADFISKAALGAADDLASTVLCAARCPVIVAPAMNNGMWDNPAVRRNIGILKKDGRVLVDPGKGNLACGTYGSGRMAEPDEILEAVRRTFGEGPLAGVRFLVTAGRTEEEIDPVRYISNRSSGRMGFALAERAADLGASVSIVHGPVDVEVPAADSVVGVRTADQMKKAVLKAFPKCDVLVMAAAVADYRPVRREKEKIKKGEKGIVLELARTDDILSEAAGKKMKGQVVVGFALESADGERNALEKIEKKGCDYIVLNMVGERTGFAAETNQVTVYRGKKLLARSGVVMKEDAAAFIIDALLGDGRLGRRKR